MKDSRSLPKLLLIVLATMAMAGCAQMRPRVPPPGSSLDSLMGAEGLNVESPVAGVLGTTPTQPGVSAPGFTPPGVSIPSADIPAAISSAIPPVAPAAIPSTTIPAPTISTPTARAVRSPDSGWKSIRGNDSTPSNSDAAIIRGQSPDGSYQPVQQVQYQPNYAPPGGYPNGAVAQPPGNFPPGPAGNLPAPIVNGTGAPLGPAPQYGAPGFQPYTANSPPNEPGALAPEGLYPNAAPTFDQIPAQPTPVDVILEETRTGRFMFGVGVNSDLGVTGNITIDERNFNIMNPPTSWDDVLNGTAWRGAGQGFRLEAQPGNRMQRYMVSFTEPYLFNTPISSSVSGYYFDRNYFDWFESRLGGRLGLGYRITPDLSISTAIRAEDVNIYQPRVNNVAILNRSLGHSDLFGAKVSLAHDTRDIPFFPTEGHLIDVSFEQVFGEFDFSRFEADWAQYFMLKERPDGSGRHTIALTLKFGMIGSDAPIFENYFAGGFSSLRGFSFRGASPSENGVRVGGRMQLLGSAEYFFPLTADDMIKGVAFCDFGTVERDFNLSGDDFRVAPGFGFRINVPALGPAPLAFDFAFPIAYADTDQRQVFSFYVGFARQ